MEDEKSKDMLGRYLAGTCTPQEKAIIESWYIKNVYIENESPLSTDDTIIQQQIWSNLQTINKRRAPVKTLWPKMAAAASLLLLLSTGYFLLQHRPKTKQFVQSMPVTPGSSKALLTLANGKQIVLNAAGVGELAKEQGATIEKTAEGNIVYQAGDAIAATTGFNTISVPLGGLYTLQLGDGTTVVLNSASTLKYPILFIGDERSVELTGEAYFEVAHNKAMPFKVKTAQQVVEVLGTHFNINSYANEGNTKTTLLEGSVKVVSSNLPSLSTNEVRLAPGQQAVLNQEGDLKVQEVNTDMAVDWKDGKFRCKNEDLESLMRKIERWYDVQVIYKDATKKSKTFSGTLSREEDIVKLLKHIELTGEVKFTIKGSAVTVF